MEIHTLLIACLILDRNLSGRKKHGYFKIKMSDIKSVLVYKWSKNDLVNQEIQKQINTEIEEEYKKNKGTTQIN